MIDNFKNVLTMFCEKLKKVFENKKRTSEEDATCFKKSCLL